MTTLLSEPIDGTATDCTFGVSSAQVTYGGPDAPGSDSGSHLWELMEAAANEWKCDLAPSNTGGTDQEYALLGTPLPPPLIDSYPRGFQLSLANKRRLLINGDTDTEKGAPPSGQDNIGENWVMELPYSDVTHDDWQEWRSGETEVDRSYATSVLLHELGLKDRVLVFGGGKWKDDGSNDWEAIYDSVEEFEPRTGAGDGFWNDKAFMTLNRVYANAVVLPTGKIFIRRARFSSTEGEVAVGVSSGPSFRRRPRCTIRV